MTAKDTTTPLAREAERLLAGFGVDPSAYRGGDRAVRSPLTGAVIAHVHDTPVDAVGARIENRRCGSGAREQTA